MSIEKMVLVNIVGSLKALDKTLLKVVESELFHLESVDGGNLTEEFSHINEQNPYVEILHKCEDLLDILELDKVYTDYSSLKLNYSNMEDKVEKLYKKAISASRDRNKLISSVNVREKSLLQIKHIIGLKANLNDVFESRYASARFGRIPSDNYIKLGYFKNKDFFFVPFDNDKDYYWGVYFMPTNKAEEIDEIFKSLYFEEYSIPDYVTGTPELAAQNIHKIISEEKIQIETNSMKINKIRKEDGDFLLKIYSKIKMLHDTFNYRKFAVVFKREFRLEGFVPYEYFEKFKSEFSNNDDVIIDVMPAETDERIDPPVKLKTCKLFKPFEMFVETYGLPKYGAINPASYIGFIYSVLFGIMFGDFGQGAVVIIAGYLLWKFRKLMLGRILMRCGVCSMIFGFISGSIFGFEDNFKSFWNAVGLGSTFPLNVLKSDVSMVLLMLSLGFGIVIILVSICINIYLGFKKGNVGSALFSHNGLAGFIVYGGVIFAAILLLGLGVNLFSPLFLILVVLIPLLLIFFGQPLTRKLFNNKKEENEKFSVVDASFEMFDTLMSYCTNTLSFLRVGGFILSHAALMLVVMRFSEMAGSIGSPFVIIFGNAFIMALEGLIVGIQVLRLVYYETFSRFYSGDGKPFNPAKVIFKKAEK